mgnify:CR=1 FL=1
MIHTINIFEILYIRNFMDLKSKQLELQYQGYLNTSLLWKDHAVLGLNQLELPEKSAVVFDKLIPDQLRLGKRVERFVNTLLQQHENIEILAENEQIQNDKITIGEIDSILKFDDVPIHLEIVFKFYLYDPLIGSSEIEHWIGPNRNDNLVKKLHKLKDKQLPLIRNIHTKPLLRKLKINLEDILQRVHFKALLFEPYNTKTIEFKLLNKDCLKGFYIHFSEIQQFSQSKFYIPSKTDWLQDIHPYVNWLTFESFNKILMIQINEKRAPLCWIKFPNGILKKFFVVWWD